MKEKWSLNLWLWLGTFGAHEIFSSVFRQELIVNKGISFGTYFQGISWLLVGLLGALFWQYYHSRQKGWELMLVGGVVNLADRLRFSGVRDYWQIPGLNIYNNVNDLIIVGGVILIFVSLLWKK